ncbi:hypothetical protein [Niveibacterium terrae]|uniref:hypothetical protein n=1 Tax=Niveibacterium terrae TaxID=3373598 RepID=UPI003A9183D0
MRREIEALQAQRQIVAIALIGLGTLALLASLHIVPTAALRACPPLIADFPTSHPEVM